MQKDINIFIPTSAELGFVAIDNVMLLLEDWACNTAPHLHTGLLKKQAVYSDGCDLWEAIALLFKIDEYAEWIYKSGFPGEWLSRRQ